MTRFVFLVESDQTRLSAALWNANYYSQIRSINQKLTSNLHVIEYEEQRVGVQFIEEIGRVQHWRRR